MKFLCFLILYKIEITWKKSLENLFNEEIKIQANIQANIQAKLKVYKRGTQSK